MAQVSALGVGTPEYRDANNAPAVAYARPDEIEVERTRSDATQIEVVLNHALSIGPVVRLELQRNDSGEFIEVELTRERYRELKPQVGERLFILPRKLKVFLNKAS